MADTAQTPPVTDETPHYFVPVKADGGNAPTDIVDSLTGQPWHHYAAKAENRDKIANADVRPVTRKAFDAGNR